MSASTTAASATPAKVVALGHHLRPEQDAALAAAKRARISASRPGWAATSASSRKRSSSGSRAASSASSCSVPAPRRATSAAPQAGQQLGAARGGRSGGSGADRPRGASAPRRSPGSGGSARRPGSGARARLPRRLRRRIALPPPSASLPELGEERRRERVARLAPEIDDPHRRERAREPAAELEPLQPLPALRPRRRAAVDGDRALERGALRGDGARVVARVGLLLVGGVVLLVDADQPERGNRGEDRGAGADDDRRLAEAIRSRSSRRSASVSAEWRTATRSPKRARKRPSACGVSAISGTSTIAPRPRASASARRPAGRPRSCRCRWRRRAGTPPPRRRGPRDPASAAPAAGSARRAPPRPGRSSRARGARPLAPRRAAGATSRAPAPGVEP